LRARLEFSATVLLIIVALLVGGITVWDRLYPQPTQAAREETSLRPVPAPPPADPVSIEGAPILGDKNARVALIVFSEFECPYCAKSARDVLPEIDRHYLSTGKVLLVWRHFPLPIHKNARKAAEAAECAGRQGKFWEFHDWAFEHQKSLNRANLHAAAETLGLRPAEFRVCLDGAAAAARVEADFAAGQGFTIAGTPTWFVGVIQADGKGKVTDRLDGARNFAVFKKTIDKVIATLQASS
jgi:protein-disulfide isomerase